MRKKLKIGIIDYKINNILSVYNAFQRLDCDVQIIRDYNDKINCDGIVLPGVGSFGEAMNYLNFSGLSDFIRENALIKKIPFLGICLGMQLMADESIEVSYNKGLSLIEGNIKKIDTNNLYRVPHVGWNNIIFTKESKLFNAISESSNFYFVHSYYYSCKEKYILGKVDYGIKFTAAIQNDNIFGVQFHPERSQRVGFQLLQNFIQYI